MGTITSLILVASLAFTAAVPTGLRHSCAQTCSPSNASKFSYEQGTSYVYDYESSTVFMETDLDNDVTVKGKATLGVLGPCEFVLSMSDIILDGSSETEQFASKISQNPLRFAYDDGKIANICSVEGEEEWVLNFKRGVLSNFQNSMTFHEEIFSAQKTIQQSVTEIDITGECKTTYHQVYQFGETKSNRTHALRKRKRARDCTRTPVGSQTTLPKQLQNMPIISADVTCQQTVAGGVMKEIYCTEQIAMKPLFSDNHATTLITTKMQITSEAPGVISADFSNMKISTLEFQNDKPREDERFTKIEYLLSELEFKSSPVISREVPALFSELVKRLKNLDTRQIRDIYLHGPFKASNAWKFLIDAAPLVSTAASTSVMTELVKKGDVTTKQADIWYSSLAFVQNPDPYMFIPLTNLINDVPSKNAIIGAASLLKQYCQADSNCMTDENVIGFVSAIEQNLGSACRSTSIEEKKIILASLRALKIIGQWTKKDVLNSCFMDVNNPSDIRVAAIDTYKNAPCSYDKSQIIEMYSNAKYDSELRINAYLALMSCPTAEHVHLIINKLKSESANQVGTFVWNHLSNLQESGSNEKQWIRSLIGEESLNWNWKNMKKINYNGIQYSRNMETSFYMEELGIGSTVESNLIFSSNFLPRSGMFNLSFDIFGESINFIEVGGRIEGFEIFAEKFFGSDGYYPERNIEHILKQLRQRKQEEETSFESQPEGSYYMRIFGTDVGYHSFHGIENFYELQPKFDMSTFLAQFMSSGETQYSKSFKFVDTELQYPTTSGFPLSLKLNGTANVGIKVDGEFSMRGFNDMDIHGHLYPSAAFEIDALMTVNTHFEKSGIKMRLNGQTSVMFDGNIKIDGVKIVDITLNMTEQEKIQLLSVKSDFVIIKNNIELEPTTADTTRIESSCMPMVGVELCSQYGPNEISFFLSKTDVHDSYKLRYLNEENSVSLLVDMPNSAFDRKIYLTAAYHEDEFKRDGFTYEFMMDLHTPWKSINSTALVALKNRCCPELKIDVEMTIDNVATYQGGVELNMPISGTTYTTIPSIFIIKSGEKIIDITGRIEADLGGNKFEVMLESNGLLPAKLRYLWDPKHGSTAMDISFNSSTLDVSAKLENELTDNKFHTEFELEYNFMRKYTDTVKFNLNLQDLSENTLNKYMGSLDLYSNFIPFDKIHIGTEITCNNEDLSIKTNVDVGYIFNMDAEAKYKHIASSNFQEDRLRWVAGIDNDVSMKWNLYDNHYEARLTTKASNSLLAVNGVYIDPSGHETFLGINAASGALHFKTNFAGRNVSLVAKMNTEGLEKVVEVEGKWGEKTMDSRISFNGKVIEAEFRFDTIVKKIRAEITGTGAKITLNLSPSEIVEGELHYSFHKNKSDVKVTVRTPFGTYTKQELILSLNRPTYNDFSGMIGLTWRDMNLITINVSGKLESGIDPNEAMLSISSVNEPSVFGFKQASFLVENTRRGYDFDSNIEGSFDGVQLIKGTVKTKVENSLATIDVRLSTMEHDFIIRIEAKLDDKSFNIRFQSQVISHHQSHQSSEVSKFGGSLKLRKNAPYELEFGRSYIPRVLPNGMDTGWNDRFHIMMDSTCSLIWIYQLLLLE